MLFGPASACRHPTDKPLRRADVEETVHERALIVLKPELEELAAMKELRVYKAGGLNRTFPNRGVEMKAAYGRKIPLEEGQKVDVYWVSAKGDLVPLLRNYSMTENRLDKVKPEDHLGFVRVIGTFKYDSKNGSGHMGLWPAEIKEVTFLNTTK